MALRRGTGVLLAAAALLALVGLVGCGEDDFENNPRAPVPLEASVEINGSGVNISPASFGAGIVNFAIANTTDAEVVLTLSGPTEASSDPVPAQGTTVFPVEMETGDYEAAVEGNDEIEPFVIEVGPERPSGQDDLLLP